VRRVSVIGLVAIVWEVVSSYFAAQATARQDLAGPEGIGVRSREVPAFALGSPIDLFLAFFGAKTLCDSEAPKRLADQVSDIAVTAGFGITILQLIRTHSLGLATAALTEPMDALVCSDV
jgi:hypothetical protein